MLVQAQTGTFGRLHQLALTLAPKSGDRSKSGAIPVKATGINRDRNAPADEGATVCAVKQNAR